MAPAGRGGWSDRPCPSAALLIAKRARRLRTPIDHLLFSPNASPLLDDLDVAIVIPALARQNTDLLASDMARARADRRKTTGDHLHRAWMVANRVHQDLHDMVFGTRWVEFDPQTLCNDTLG